MSLQYFVEQAREPVRARRYTRSLSFPIPDHPVDVPEIVVDGNVIVLAAEALDLVLRLA